MSRPARIDYVPDPTMSFWPTPPDVANDLVFQSLSPGWGDGRAAGEVPQVRVLEPSAGDGHLIRAVRARLPGAHIAAVEPSPRRAAMIRSAPGLANEVIESTLEDYLSSVTRAAMGGSFASFDAVIMNPPFTLPDRPESWAEHFLAIYRDPYLLGPWGQISAVVPRIVMTGKSKLVRAVRELLHPVFGMNPCGRNAFGPVGAQLSTCLIWAEKTTARRPHLTGEPADPPEEPPTAVRAVSKGKRSPLATLQPKHTNDREGGQR